MKFIRNMDSLREDNGGRDLSKEKQANIKSMIAVTFSKLEPRVNKGSNEFRIKFMKELNNDGFKLGIKKHERIDLSKYYATEKKDPS
jgi:hypothetical protein